MSDKVWITANSELIPYEKLTDTHLQNCVEWCDLRIDSLKATKLPTDPAEHFRVQRFVNREWARVADLKMELQGEQSRRKTLAANTTLPGDPGVRFTVTADRDVTYNGVLYRAGRKIKVHQPRGSRCVFSA